MIRPDGRNSATTYGLGDEGYSVQSPAAKVVVNHLRGATTWSAVMVGGRMTNQLDLGSRDAHAVWREYALAVDRLRPWRDVYGRLETTPVVVPSRVKQEAVINHGTSSQYNRGCRCVPCTTYNAERHRARRLALREIA